MFVQGKKPLFKGVTRVAKIGWIPRNVALIIFMISATLFMTLHFWSLLVFVVLWSIAAALTKYDDRIFRIIGLWWQTKFSNYQDSPFKSWGGSSYSPVSYKKKRLK